MSKIDAVITQLKNKIHYKARVNSIPEAELRRALIEELTKGVENERN